MNLNRSRTFMPVVHRLPNEKTYDSDETSSSSDSDETSSSSDSDTEDGYSTTSSQERDEKELLQLLESYVKGEPTPV